jgi:anti-sigma factor RsiW
MRDLLEEYFEGTLPAPKRDAVSEHIAVCESCAAELDQIRRMAAALEAAPRVVPDADLVRSISARVSALPEPAWRRAVTAGWGRVGVIAAAFIAIFAAVGYLLTLALGKQEALLPWTVLRAKEVIAQLGDWTAVTASAAIAVWQSAEHIGAALWLAARGFAPTLGVYAAAEIGILLAVILVLHHGRRRPLARQTSSA